MWILALVPGLFFFRETFPVVFDFFSLLTPELTNDLGDLWVRKAGVFLNHTSLVMLAVKDEGVARSWNFGWRRTDAYEIRRSS